jgi:hypothetical protein
VARDRERDGASLIVHPVIQKLRDAGVDDEIVMSYFEVTSELQLTKPFVDVSVKFVTVSTKKTTDQDP